LLSIAYAFKFRSIDIFNQLQITAIKDIFEDALAYAEYAITQKATFFSVLSELVTHKTSKVLSLFPLPINFPIRRIMSAQVKADGRSDICTRPVPNALYTLLNSSFSFLFLNAMLESDKS
jgi:hypothetical protein